jgi:hypothetical protein
MGRFQKSVPGTKSAFVSPEGWPVERVDLCAKKIQIPPAHLRTSANELDVSVGKRDNPRNAKVFLQRALDDLIERNFPSERTVAEFEEMICASAGNTKRFRPRANDGAKRRAALRLQAQENAGRFQDRRLALSISAHKKIKPRGELDPERFEAAKISKLKFSEHAIITAVAVSLCRG